MFQAQSNSIPCVQYRTANCELRESVGEEELDTIASRVRHDFEATLLAVRLGLLKMVLLIVPSFFYSEEGISFKMSHFGSSCFVG